MKTWHHTVVGLSSFRVRLKRRGKFESALESPWPQNGNLIYRCRQFSAALPHLPQFPPSSCSPVRLPRELYTVYNVALLSLNQLSQLVAGKAGVCVGLMNCFSKYVSYVRRKRLIIRVSSKRSSFPLSLLLSFKLLLVLLHEGN